MLCAEEGVGVVFAYAQVGVAMDWLVGRRGKGRINGGGWRGEVAPRRLTKVGVGRKCGTEEAGGRVDEAWENGRWSRRSELPLVEVAVAVVEVWEEKGPSRDRELCLGEGGRVVDNCARTGRMQVQCSSICWERSLKAMLMVL